MCITLSSVWTTMRGVAGNKRDSSLPLAVVFVSGIMYCITEFDRVEREGVGLCGS